MTKMMAIPLLFIHYMSLLGVGKKNAPSLYSNGDYIEINSYISGTYRQIIKL